MIAQGLEQPDAPEAQLAVFSFLQVARGLRYLVIEENQPLLFLRLTQQLALPVQQVDRVQVVALGVGRGRWLTVGMRSPKKQAF